MAKSSLQFGVIASRHATAEETGDLEAVLTTLEVE